MADTDSTTVQTLLTPVMAAGQLGMTPGALAQWRYLGTGPSFLKLGGRAVRYRQSDLDAWLETTVRTRTDDRPGAA